MTFEDIWFFGKDKIIVEMNNETFSPLYEINRDKKFIVYNESGFLEDFIIYNFETGEYHYYFAYKVEVPHEFRMKKLYYLNPRIVKRNDHR